MPQWNSCWWGRGGQGDPNLPLLVPYIPSSCPFILAFLPIALVYRLQNTKDCRVIYPLPLFPLSLLLSPLPIFSDISPPCLPSPHFPKGDIAVARRSLTHYEIFKYFV